MIKKNIAYKFRIYPNKKQDEFIRKTIGCCRFIYNKMLEDKLEHYQKSKKQLLNTPAQYKDEFPFLKEVDSTALAGVQMDLKSAFTKFFKEKRVKFPKFKSKKYSKQKYTHYGNTYSLKFSEDNKRLRVGKLGYVKVVVHRDIPSNYKIKRCTITKTKSGKYYASILFEYYIEPMDKVKINNDNQVVGLDYSSKGFYYSSDNELANYPRYYRSTQDKLAKAQKKLSRMKEDSNNYNKQRIKIAKISEKIANQRLDFIHKKSRELVNRYDAVIFEDLNMDNMKRNLKLGKSTSDNSFGKFRDIIKYKLEDEGKYFVKIDKWYPSSKTCSSCGYKKDKLLLSERIYECENCGLVIDRDYNASLNIKRVGMTQLA